MSPALARPRFPIAHDEVVVEKYLVHSMLVGVLILVNLELHV